MPLFERVTIAGVGLIGGSLAAAGKAAGLFGEVVGYGRTANNLELAQQRGLIDRFELDAAQAATGADLLVLAVPVQAMAEVARVCAPRLARGAIVSDVGSVKAAVVSSVEAALPPGVPFVGAHPIAGGEDTGAAAADRSLFAGAECIVTPGTSSSAEAIDKVSKLWRGVGMRVEIMDAEAHDRVLAWVSHLPHALAFAMVRAIAAAAPDAVAHGGPSLADMSRIAASSPEMWRDIFLANAAALGGAIDTTIAELQSLRAEIARHEPRSLLAWLERARSSKLQWPAERRTSVKVKS